VHEYESPLWREHFGRGVYIGFSTPANLEAASEALVVFRSHSGPQRAVGRAAGNQVKSFSWCRSRQLAEVGTPNVDDWTRGQLLEGSLSEEETLCLSFDTKGESRFEPVGREEKD